MNKDKYVYCTTCKHFRLDDEGVPYCIYEDKCYIYNHLDGRILSERPCYESI